MKPVRAPQLVDRGIAIYVPSINDYTQAKIQIYYSPKNPLFNWSYCEDSPYLIWEKTDYQYGKGIIFIYNSPTILPKGFYKIRVSVFNKDGNVLGGFKIYGLLKSKNTLHIGLPYSSFAPISLS